MKRFLSLFAVALLIATASAGVAHAQEAPNRFPVEQDGQWGYIDRTGEVVIAPQFDEAAFFSDGWARVKVGETFKFIDADGKVVLEPEVEWVRSFSEGLAVAKPAGSDSLGYIDKTGQFVIAPRFAQAFAFSEGRAAVDANFENSARASFGYIDESGAFVVGPQFWGARRFSEGLAPVLVGGFVDGQWGYINPEGEMVVEPQFAEALPFSDGRAAVAVGEGFDAKWGYIDESGKQVIAPQFELARAFSEGLAPVEDAFDDWHYVDRAGQYAIQTRYNVAEPFRGALARVAQEGSAGYGHQGGAVGYMTGNLDWRYIDRQGRQVWPRPERETARAEENAASASATGSLEENLRPLLPEQAAGWSRTAMQFFDEPQGAEARYEKESLSYSIDLFLGYGSVPQQFARSMLQRARESKSGAVQQTERNGRPLHVLHAEEENVGLIVFSGEMSAMFLTCAEARGCTVRDAEAARNELLALYDAFDIERLAAFQPGGSARALEIDAPEGFATFAAGWPSARVALAYPEGWTITDLHTATGFVQGVSIMQSAEAAAELYGDGISISTEDDVRLVTPENVIVNISLMGVEASSTTPLDMIESMAGAAVADAEVTQPPQAVTFDGGAAALREVRGTDADGRAVVGQQWMIERGGQLVSVSVFLPAGRAEALKSTVQAMLESIVLEPAR